MFALFFNLYIAMFSGIWVNIPNSTISRMLTEPVNAIGTLITSIFNNVDTPFATLGDILFASDALVGRPYWMSLVSFTLALITSIGIVVMAVKGIKRVFSIFFMPIR